MGNVKKKKRVKTIDIENTKNEPELSRKVKVLSNSTENLTPKKIAEIRKRINENFYDRMEVLDVVAEKILHSPRFQEIFQFEQPDEDL